MNSQDQLLSRTNGKPAGKNLSKGLQEICCEDFGQIWSREDFTNFLQCCGLQESDCFPEGELDAEWVKTDTEAAAGTRCLSHKLYIKVNGHLEPLRFGIAGTIGTVGEYCVWAKVISTAHSCRPSDLLTRKNCNEPLWKRTKNGTFWFLTESGEEHAHRLAKLVGMEVAGGKKDCPTPTYKMMDYQSSRKEYNDQLLTVCLKRTRKTLLGLTGQANLDCYSRFTRFKGFTFASAESRLLMVTIAVSPSVMSLFVPMGCSTFGGGLHIAQRLMFQPDGINKRKIVAGGDDRLLAGGNGILFSVFGETRESYNVHKNEYYATPLLADTNPVPIAEAAIARRTRPMACPIPAADTSMNKEGELRRVYPREPTRSNMLRLASQMIATTGDDIEPTRAYLEKFLQSIVDEMEARGTIPTANMDDEEATIQLRARVVSTLDIVWLWSIMMQWVHVQFHGLQSPEDWVKLLSWVSFKFHRVSYETLMARELPIRQTCVTRLTRTLFRAAFNEPALAFLDGQARVAAVVCAVMNRAPSSDINELVENVNVDAEDQMNKRLDCQSCGIEAQLNLVFQLIRPGRLFDEDKRKIMNSFSSFVQQVASSAAKISVKDCMYGILEDIARNLKECIPPELSEVIADNYEELTNVWPAKQRRMVCEQFEAARGDCPDLNLLIVSYYKDNAPRDEKSGGPNSSAWIDLFDYLENRKSGQRSEKKGKPRSSFEEGSEKGAAMLQNNNIPIRFNSALAYLVNFVAQPCLSVNSGDRRAIDTAKSLINGGGSQAAPALPKTETSGSNLERITDLLTYGHADNHLSIAVASRDDEKVEPGDEERTNSNRKKVVKKWAKSFFIDQTCDEIFAEEVFIKVWLSCLGSQPARADEAKRFIEILPKSEMGSVTVVERCARRLQVLVLDPAAAITNSIIHHFQEGSGNNARKTKLYHKVMPVAIHVVKELYNQFGRIIPIPQWLSELMPYLFCNLTADFFGPDAVSAQTKKRKDTRGPDDIDGCSSNIPTFIYAIIFIVIRMQKEDEPKPMIQFLEEDKWRQLGGINVRSSLNRRGDPVDWFEVWQPKFIFNLDYFDCAAADITLPREGMNLREVFSLFLDGLPPSGLLLNKLATLYDKHVFRHFSVKSICDQKFNVWSGGVNGIVKKKTGNRGRKKMTAGDTGLAEQVRGGPPASNANAPPMPEEHNDGCDDHQADSTRLEFEIDDDKKDAPAFQLNRVHGSQGSVGGNEEEPNNEQCLQGITVGQDAITSNRIGREKVEIICGKQVDTYLFSKMSDQGNEAGILQRRERIMSQLEKILPSTLTSLIKDIDANGGDGDGDGDDFNYVDQGGHGGGADNTGGDCKDNSQSYDISNNTQDDTNGNDNEIDGRNNSKDRDHQAEFKIGAIGHGGTSLPCQADWHGVRDQEISTGDEWDNKKIPPRDKVNRQLFGKHLALMPSGRSAGREDDRVIRHGIQANYTGTDNISDNAVVDSDVNSAECVEAMSQLMTAPIALDDDAEGSGLNKVTVVEVVAKPLVTAGRSARPGPLLAESGEIELSKKKIREERLSEDGGQSSNYSRPNHLSARGQHLDSGVATASFLSSQAAAAATDTFTLSSRNKKPHDGKPRRSLEEPLQVAVSQQQLKPAKPTGLFKDWADLKEGKVRPEVSTGGAAAAGNKKSSSHTGEKWAMKGTQAPGKSFTQIGPEAGKKISPSYASEKREPAGTKSDAKTRSRSTAPGSIKEFASKTGGARNDTLLANKKVTHYAGQFSPGKRIQVREDGILLESSASGTKECKKSSDEELKEKQQRIAMRRHSQRLNVVKTANGAKAAAEAARFSDLGDQESQTEEEEAVRATKKTKTNHRTLRQPSFDPPRDGLEPSDASSTLV